MWGKDLGDAIAQMIVWAFVGMGLTALLLLGGAIWLAIWLIQHVRFV